MTPAIVEGLPLLPGYARWRTAGTFPASVRREALHEAGHAAIAEVVGLSVEFATMSGREGSEALNAFVRHTVPSRDDPLRFHRLAIVALAGNAADGRDWRRVRGAEGMSDREHARDAAAAVTPDAPAREALLVRLWRVTRWLTRRYRPAIERVAADLLMAETLSGSRVRAILGLPQVHTR